MNQRNASAWAGIAISTIVTVLLVADAGMNLLAPEVLRADMEATGVPPELATALGVIILICAVLYAIPQTAILGAILISGFLGGAICTHFRIGEFGSPPQLICLLLGVATWGGLYLRDPKIRALLPFRTSAEASGL